MIRLSRLRWVHAPLYLVIAPFVLGVWAIKHVVDAGCELANAVTGSENW